jgi:copper oxidase (laccase) domain-containing protein
MTQDEIIEMWHAANGTKIKGEQYEVVEAFAKLVARHEREACAWVCEQTNDGTPYNLAGACAEAIRAKGQA